MAAWRKIATAPKDRTPVIVAARSSTGGWIVGEARFVPEYREGTWWWANMDENDFDGPTDPIIPEPVYWQSMPSSPAKD